MGYAEDFLIQWDTLREEMVQSMNFQTEQNGELCFADVNHLLQSKTRRWSSRMSAEGRWMEALEDKKCVQEVQDALKDVSLREIPLQPSGNGNTMELVAGIGGAVVGTALGSLLPLGMVTTAAGGICGGIAGWMLSSSKLHGRKKETLILAVKDYSERIEQIGQQIADIWRQHESSCE